MNYTQIKRLFQNNTEFVPITLAEAVVVNTSTLPTLQNLGITTLDKVLSATLSQVNSNITNISNLSGAVATINQQLVNKLDKTQLKYGAGISISTDENTGDVTISANYTFEMYKILTSQQWDDTYKNNPNASYENIIYLVPTSITAGNLFQEFLCIKDGNQYKWEQIGVIQTEVDLSGYVTNETYHAFVDQVHTYAITAEHITTSQENGSKKVIVSYTIPADLYDNVISVNDSDNISDPPQEPSEEP